MQRIKVKNFNLNSTLECGQAFRWNKEGEWWFGVVKGIVIKTKQEGDTLYFAASKKIDSSFIIDYLRLDDNLEDILTSINKDPYISKAIRTFNGLRLLRQEFNECLLSFICSSASNIPKIKRSIENLSRAFGKPIKFEGKQFYSFPTPQRLQKADLGAIKACGVGFRAKYLKEAAKMTAGKSLKPSQNAQQREFLLTIPGVGEKVADCIMLFSAGQLDSFPIDVWMQRVMKKYYLKGKKSQLSLFGKLNFGQYAGYAQQYLYHYSRTTKLL